MELLTFIVVQTVQYSYTNMKLGFMYFSFSISTHLRLHETT